MMLRNPDRLVCSVMRCFSAWVISQNKRGRAPMSKLSECVASGHARTGQDFISVQASYHVFKPFRCMT